MKKAKVAVVVMLALSVLLTVVSSVMLWCAWNLVRDSECTIDKSTTASVPPDKAAEPTNKVVTVMSVGSPYCDEQGAVEIGFSKMPCADDLRRGIKIQPPVADLSIDMRSGYKWSKAANDYQRQYLVRFRSPAFKFRQPYVVSIRRDLHFDDGYALDRDYRESVERPDIRPSVSMAHAGRYLSAASDRILALDCVNVSRVNCSVWRVLPENFVQLLAREERQYTKSLGFWQSCDGDSDATIELSTTPFEWTEAPVNRLNEIGRHSMALRMDHGVVTNGVYLLAVGDGDRKRGQYDDRYDEYRLVCVTDIGLSVRRDRRGLRAWITSLATGKPLSDMEVKLYAANRMVLAEGRSDAQGEVRLSGWDERYVPFALVAVHPQGSDAAFMALRDSMKLEESLPDGQRPEYLATNECTALVWTERGIYRHGERIMTHVLLRNGEGNAPKPFPVEVRLEAADGREVSVVTVLPDEFGALHTEAFAAPDNHPSGKWKIQARIPGKPPVVLGEREIKIEEFVPPQVRVRLKDLPTAQSEATNLVYKVAAEHLFGGPAKRITAESLVSFTDVDFVPRGWDGFRFGDPTRGLKPNYTRLPKVFTDDRGEATFAIGMNAEWGEPKAAVRVTIQGSVFETGGRPSVARDSRVIHRYPYYLGSNVPRHIRQGSGMREFAVAQVNPDGQALRTARTLKAKLWKVEYVYNLVQDRRCHWDSQQIRRPVAIDETVQVGTNGVGTVKLPVTGSGDYELVVRDEELGLSHTAAFWLAAAGDDEIRASMKNPTEVSIAADQTIYREGDRPRVTLKCPFRGFAWLSVMREQTLSTRVIEVTNLTQSVELEPLDGAWAPNVDVAVSLVQAVDAERNHQAGRAHGLTSLRIRTRDSEIPVKIASSVKCAERGGSELRVRVDAKGAAATGERAVITVVDEGINLLTGEKVPDPIGYFSIAHGGWHPLYDVFGRLLPILGEGLASNGIKTGGDDLAGMMNRVSPVPTRRFQPLSQWQMDVALTNGTGETTFLLPEFVGEVRITAFVYNRRATGCNAVHQPVCPKLVMQPDAPRFAAPGDRFYLTLTLRNRSGKPGEVEYDLESTGAVALTEDVRGRIALADGDSQTLTFPVVAKDAIGSGIVTYRARGMGENHVSTIELPVRPAVSWETQAEVVRLHPGETFVSTNFASGSLAKLTQRTLAVSDSPIAELRAAFDYLTEYPHGCLEQTTSRMFPLLCGWEQSTNTLSVLKAGVARVVSMLHEHDFTMWPDCNYPPWDREVSLYAAHFLIAASVQPELGVGTKITDRVCALLKRWAYDADTNVAVYACHSLALAGRPEKDRMYALYDLRDRLSLCSRARLARAFVRIGDPKRARELVADGAADPQNVREAALALLTRLELDSRDPRLAKLALYLQRHRDKQRFHWGTTADNAHALLALGAYYQANGVREGKARVRVSDGHGESLLAAGASRRFCGGEEIRVSNCGSGDAYLSMGQAVLPAPNAVGHRHHLIRVSRRFMTSEGFEADLKNLTRGELLIGEIVLTADRKYDFSDLVIQELLPACLEPDRQEVAEAYGKHHGFGNVAWQLRHDVRDDRILVFSKPVTIDPEADGKNQCVFRYAVRVITPGEFVLPGTLVEAMYAPEIHARLAPAKLCVRP